MTLDNCPFCGGKSCIQMDQNDVDDIKLYAECTFCYARSDWHYHKEDVAHAWNKRVETPSSLAQTLVEASKMLDDAVSNRFVVQKIPRNIPTLGNDDEEISWWFAVQDTRPSIATKTYLGFYPTSEAAQNVAAAMNEAWS